MTRGKPRTILSVCDKMGIVEQGRGLEKLGGQRQYHNSEFDLAELLPPMSSVYFPIVVRRTQKLAAPITQRAQC